MTGHRSLLDQLYAEYDQADPGAGGTIAIEHDRAILKLESAGAEARTLRPPVRAGVRCTLVMSVDMGAITITQTDEDGDNVQFDNSANTSIVMQDVGDWVDLIGVDEAGTLQWRIVGGEGATGSVDISAVNVGITDSGSLITATEVEGALAELAAKGQDMAVTAGVGITGAADSFVSGVQQVGTLYKTTIVVEVDGLNGGGTADDIIGDDGSGVAHLGQITAARSGTIFAGSMTCLELPAGEDVDIDLHSADEATGVEDTAISALSNVAKLVNAGDWTAGAMKPLTLFPAADQYLYLTNGDVTTSGGLYSGGIFLIELWGK